MVQIAQRAQANTNGYFGGYIGKAQPAGHMEIKKCIDKMYTLRDSLARENKALLKKNRAVSNRVAIDLEMNGVFRGAVEQFNLASNLKRNDVLFPECIRTFATRSIDTQVFFHRLITALQNMCRYTTMYTSRQRTPRVRNADISSHSTSTSMVAGRCKTVLSNCFPSLNSTCTFTQKRCCGQKLQQQRFAQSGHH